MGEKLVIGPINKGLRTDREPFVIDNDSFPNLINAYQWRGRVKRKRGTSLLGRLNRFFDSTNPSYGATNSTITLSAGAGNILTGFATLQSSANLVPGTITVTDGSTHYVDTGGTGVFYTGSSPVASSSVNYVTGAIVIPPAGSDSVSAKFYYYPCLPVMGLESLGLDPTAFQGTLGFDTTYAYNFLLVSPYSNYSVSFYKNPASTVSPVYNNKSNPTPVSWNGQNYQQFWSANYQGALWVTNGIAIPFSIQNIGMQYAPSSTIMWSSCTTHTITVTITNCPLVVGDFVFLNEWFVSASPNTASYQLNFQSGYVTAVSGSYASLTVTITLPYSGDLTTGSPTYIPGIVQYLTNRSDATKDCIRWYDGDPTNGSYSNPQLTGVNGWVNFCPPLSSLNYQINDAPAAQYYLVGARMIVPFKDRLLFIGPVIQTSAAGSQIYLQDTVIYSQNGTPYYTASFNAGTSAGAVLSSKTVFNPILVPANQSATPTSYFEDVTGFGGFVAAGIDQPIVTVSPNEDALIMGLTRAQVRFIYTGNDILPFNFFIVNAELGSGSTFSSVNMDKGVITRGSRGYIITSQVESRRIDLDILDQVFEANLSNNGSERICAQRDFINEWIYFTYSNNGDNVNSYVFPNQTLQYNYRDESWAIFNETYTTYGTFYRQSGFTWATVGARFSTWSVWNEPWNSGESTQLEPIVIAGNQQGFVVFRAQGTNEANSLYIQSISGNIVTSPNHCLNVGDYIIISGCLGLTGINGNIYSVGTTSQNTFILISAYPNPTGTYLGGGVIQRMYVPFIQTKQFPTAWELSRKTRLGAQQYLLSTTANGQVTLLIYLSQDGNNPYNAGPIVPAENSINNSLIYSTILYTCPESTNLGLTPANTNLQMPTAASQQQIWHRVNTSLLGDTVQLGITLNDAQMRQVDSNNKPISQFAEIELHCIILDVSPSQWLA